MDAVTTPEPERMRYAVTTWADARGVWHARVETAWTLSENEKRARYNVGTYWASIRASARNAIRAQLNERGTVDKNYRLRIDVEEILDPCGHRFGSGLMNGAIFVEAN